MNIVETLINSFTENTKFIDARNESELCSDELKSSLSRIAFFLNRHLQPGDHIILYCDQSPLSAMVYLGALHAGLVVVPVDKSQFENVAIIILITQSRAVWSFATSAYFENIDIPIFVGDISDETDEAEIQHREEGDLAALMMTSGTTARPRFVQITHKNLVTNTQAIAKSQCLTQEERCHLILPISYCFGASVLHTHLYCGGSLVFDDRFMFPDKVLKSMQKFQCTNFAGVPSVFHILLNRSHIGGIPLPYLKKIFQAGGHLDLSIAEQIEAKIPGVRFFFMYGQTEATSRITCWNPLLHPAKPGSVGKPLDDLNLRIVDESHTDVKVGDIGHIWVSGESVTCGYWDDDETSQGILEGRWLKTGDLGRLDEDGFLWIEGRLNEFVKVAGRRISFQEIEERVRQFENVDDVGVCATTQSEAGELPVLFLVPKDGSNEEMELQIKKELPPTWNCRKFVYLKKLPLTKRGKLDRNQLKKIARQNECIPR